LNHAFPGPRVHDPQHSSPTNASRANPSFRGRAAPIPHSEFRIQRAWINLDLPGFGWIPTGGRAQAPWIDPDSLHPQSDPNQRLSTTAPPKLQRSGMFIEPGSLNVPNPGGATLPATNELVPDLNFKPRTRPGRINLDLPGFTWINLDPTALPRPAGSMTRSTPTRPTLQGPTPASVDALPPIRNPLPGDRAPEPWISPRPVAEPF
jgi:hypothetical protein